MLGLKDVHSDLAVPGARFIKQKGKVKILMFTARYIMLLAS